MTTIQHLIYTSIGLFLFISNAFSSSANVTSSSTSINAQPSMSTSSSRGEDLKRLSQLKSDIESILIKPDAFYNYSLICGGKEYESRGDRSFVDKTIPEKFRKLVQATYVAPESRANKCPKWSNNVETRPKSGSMDILSIPENTRVGEKVYLLLAMDPEQEPIYYFIRKAETEESVDDVIFRVNVIKMGFTWIGEVILDKEIDFERKKTYNYLSYAYDGFNLLEKYSLIEVTDVDDEKPVVITSGNTAWNPSTSQFEFAVFENASVGEVINVDRSILFRDVDTQNSQLNIRLVNLDSGMADSPFTLNNLGELRLTSKLDYEAHKEYLLKIHVQDMGGQFTEEIIRIEVLDVPDLQPRFTLPKLTQDTQFNNVIVSKSFGYVDFYANTLGRVFNVRAVSQNQQPLGKITYELKLNTRDYDGYFELTFNRSIATWYVDCVRKIDLGERDADLIELTVRAIESASSSANSNQSSGPDSVSTGTKLFADLKVILRIVNGDLCAPKFDKPEYEFQVLEGTRQLFEPILVEDCDHGVNGRIFLRTSRDDEFSFKIEQVYRFSKLGIQMQRAYDYEDPVLYRIDHKIEFDIIATGSNQSLNRYETRARVVVRILDLNEFAPKFVLPPAAYILKDGHPTVHMQRIFTYNVAENVDYSMDFKAIDQDANGDDDDNLFYNVRYLHPEDNFGILTEFNSNTSIFTVTVSGKWLDASSQIPIVFGVYAEDTGEPKLRTEIIIYLRPQSVDPKPAYFEFERYEYSIVENDPKPHPFELRLINDNLGPSRVRIEEIRDPLHLLSVDYEENSATDADLVSLASNHNSDQVEPYSEFTNDLFVYLYPTQPRRDLDNFFVQNNRSDVYEYKLRARLVDKPELYSDVTVLIKLIDANDNRPKLVSESPSGVTILNAILSEDFIPNALLNINSNYTVLKFMDGDFSADYGLASMHCSLNDTRFYIDIEHMMQELASVLSAPFALDRHLSLPIRVASTARVSRREEPIIWLSVVCEDNFFARALKPQFNTNSPLFVRVRILEPASGDLTLMSSSGREWFDRDQFVFTVDENFVGVVGEMATVISQAAQTLNLEITYNIESALGEQLDEHVKVNNEGELEVIKGFDYERGERLFNFSVAVHLRDPNNPLKKLEFRTSVILVVNDLNDERPRFTQPIYEFTLNANRQTKSENASLTQIDVGSVFALDLDKQDQNQLKFNLERRGSNASSATKEDFELKKREFGECAIRMPVSLAVDGAKYEFEIKVTDLAGHSATTEVSVNVKSEPLFDELKWSQDEAYSSSIKENSPVGTRLIGVSVQPVGLVTGAKLFKIGYKLAEPNEYYTIEESTGVIKTSTTLIDREETDAYKQLRLTRVYVQAYMEIDKVKYWSTVKQVNVDVIDENDEWPRFVQPSDNQTQVGLHFNRLYPMFNFSALDPDLNDRVTYSLADQRLVYPNMKSSSLPFKVNPRNGTLSFVEKDLSEDNFRMLIRHGSNKVKARLTIRAVDKSSKSSTSVLFVELPVNQLIKSKMDNSGTNQSQIPIKYELEPKVPQIERITGGSTKHYYSIDETIQPNTTIADLRVFLEQASNETVAFDTSKPELFESLKLVSLDPNEPVYFGYDAAKLSLKLIRPLDYDLVKNLTVHLGSDEWPQFKLEFNFQVRDRNNKPPELALDREESNKYGSNLILAVVDDLNDLIESTVKAISSTPPPPRRSLPAIPELGLPARILPNIPYRTPELDEKRAALKAFNEKRVIRSYVINDPDTNNTFSVRILNDTDKALVAHINGSRLIVEKTNMPLTSRRMISLELSDGVNVRNYTGEIIPIFGKQLQRLFTYLPDNGRFKGTIYRSSVGSVRIDLDPMIQIENQFPYDIVLNLTGTYAKYFQITPLIVRSSPINISPTQVDLSLRESLDKYADVFQYVTLIELECRMSTESDYLNSLLGVMGPIRIKLDLKSVNRYKPVIISYEPPSGKIYLDEGDYFKRFVASIEAFDRDQFDPGRIEYDLIGDSNLFEINRVTGDVLVNGTLDAEADQPHVFFCFARDLAPKPFGMTSELIRFELYVNDINEYPPVLMPAMTTITIIEPAPQPDSDDEDIVVGEFRFDCSDRDLNSTLTIALDGVHYVSRYDTGRIIDASGSDSADYDIRSLFKLSYSNLTDVVKDYTSAYLVYSSRLDYERLMKPADTFIRLDVSCSDGEFEAKSKVYVQVEDRNDNRPRFAHKSLTVRRNESNLLQPLVRVEASDGDLSPQYGNYSLEYSIIQCRPDIYDMYIDTRTGQLSTRLVIDLDTPEIIKQRKLMYANETTSKSQIDFLSSFNRISCEIMVVDNRLYNNNASSSHSSDVSWHDAMNLQIIVDSVNDNAPEIDLDSDASMIEVLEGESTRGMILLQIPVYDKDDATGLECLFGNGHITSDPFELKTVPQDPHTTICVFKVRNDMFVNYDIIRRSFYLLELVVRDFVPPPVYPNRGVSRAQLRVRVIPVNSRPPLFVNGADETLYVLDSVRPGTMIGTVLATDMDNPNPDRLIYDIEAALIDQKVAAMFAIKPSLNTTQAYWGAAGLFVTDKLDVAESPYLIPVIVYDGPPSLKDTLSSRKLFRVVVLNKGSMSVWVNATTGIPVDYYSIKLNEEVVADTFVCQVKAHIPNSYQTMDGGDTGDEDALKVEYSLVLDGEDDSKNSNMTLATKYYKIDRTSGRIVTTGERIDYEQEAIRQAAQNLKVRAQTKDTFFTYFSHVSIDILDVNDNSPRFDLDSTPRLFDVVENTTYPDKRRVIGRLHASDADSGLNGQFKYQLLTNTTLFAIDELNGDLICLDGSQIDRETTPYYSLEAAVVDTGDLNSTYEFTVRVLDINDNWPEFDANTRTEFAIEENSPHWQTPLNASDLDAGQNGTLLFYLEASFNPIDLMQKFRVEPLSGELELIDALDYETKTQYRLVVTCSDQGIPDKLKTNVEIIVNVIDLNDNGPKFVGINPRRVHVIESITPDTMITRVHAVDADLSSEYNQVNYQLNPTAIADPINSLFVLEALSGELRLASGHRLNVDVQREYQLQIVAFDVQRPVEYRDYLNLTIVVDPSLDKLPIFESKHSTVTLFKRSLKESTPENDYVVDIVRAVDPNQRGIVYSIDRIEAVEDGGVNSTEADPDLFSIGAHDGVVKARRRRASYTAEGYRLHIRATSKLNESLNANMSLYVHVDRMADSLYDNRVYEKAIDENCPAHMFVLQLTPRNRALANDLSLKYAINEDLSSPFNSWFKIDSHTGRIETATSEIDCEKSDEVLLTIDVTDIRTSSHIESVLVKLKINDLDDNLPLFEPIYKYEVSMDEDDNVTRKIERLVTRFRATDLDRTPRYAAVDYKLDSVSTRALSVDSFRLFVDDETREVSLFKLAGVELDRDNPTIGNKIKITVVAENPWDTVKYTRKIIQVSLIDLNDNAPRIIDTNSEISLPEDYRTNQAFYHVKASDADEPNTPNSDLVYTVRPRSSKVQIDPNGYLSLISPLDYETEHEVELNIDVFDKSNHPLTTSRQFFVHVINVNDNPPQFVDLSNDDSGGGDDDECVLSVYEDVDVGTLVHKFNAIDLDMPNSTDFIYSINGGAGLPFSIDSRSGELKTAAPLDRETTAEYKAVRISVKDPEILGKRLETSVTCRIRVLDINDNKPMFGSTQTDFKILPVIDEKTPVGFFTATDADFGNNSTIDYYLLNDFDHLFELDQIGHLFINVQKRTDSDKSPDLRDLYELSVMARDRGTPTPLESALTLRVKIDPNYFNFNQMKSEKLDLDVPDVVYLNENARSGSYVSQVRATNSFRSLVDDSLAADVNRTVNLTYVLLTCEDTFRIGALSGRIEVLDSAKLDYERIKEFILVIEAKEEQKMLTFKKSRAGQTRLVVKLINVNDNPVQFNREVYTTDVRESDTRQSIPFDIGLDPLIEITDPDLDGGVATSGGGGSGSNGRMLTTVSNQLNPVDIFLSGPDASTFRLVKVTSTLATSPQTIQALIGVYRVESLERFDYEVRTLYEFNVTAFDGVFKTSVRVLVNVVDVNDNRPIFDRADYSFRIDENAPQQTEVGRVHATDLDATQENNYTLYKITSLAEMTVFGISERTGVIYVRDSSRLDREKTPTFNLTVVAYNPDYPDLFDTARVLVHLNDLNDQTPRFERQLYQVTIREKWKKLPRLLGHLHATDLDLAENGTVTYSIESINGRSVFKDSSPPFYVDKVNGFFFLNAYLDADVDMGGASSATTTTSKSFEIRIVAQDSGGLLDKTTVMVTLIDVNDHPPVVIMPKVSEFVQDENSPLNTTLVTVRCIDPDYKHVHVTYELERDLNKDYQSFALDSFAGLLSNLIVFDYETKNEYRVRINCVDTGIMINFDDLEINTIGQMVNDLDHSYSHNLVTKLDLIIKVRDLDDNEPDFSELDRHLAKNISEYLEPNATVAILPTARDRDTLPENTDVRYIILPGDDSDASDVLEKFALNETTGELTLRDELESSEHSFYELHVKATSRLHNHRTDEVNMRVNESDPSQLTLQLFVVKDRLTIEFEQQNYYVSLKVVTPADANGSDDDDPDEELRHPHEMLDLKRRRRALVRDLGASARLDKTNGMPTSVFFARAHLIKRKLKRTLRFNIEMAKVIKSNQNAIIKLSNSLINRFNETSPLSNMLTSEHLFWIEEQSGKVYISPEALKQSNYRAGDRLLLTISVESHPLGSASSDLVENALCQVSVRLTDRDYTFVLPLSPRLTLERIYMDYLNPLRHIYLPRNFEADGVKIAVQDLIVQGRNKPYLLLVQVESTNGLKPIDLEMFAELWKNYSTSGLSNRLGSDSDLVFVERQAETADLPKRSGERDLVDSDSLSPFYSTWQFWLWSLIGLMNLFILILFVYCIKITKKTQCIDHAERPGIIIEYPPGVNPIYNNGVLSLNANNNKNNIRGTAPANAAVKRRAPTRVVSVKADENSEPLKEDFEEQEAQVLVDEDDEDINV